MMDGPEGVSFLWPPGRLPGTADPEPRLGNEQAADLELDSLVGHLCLNAGERPWVRGILLQFCSDPEVLTWRHGVLESLLDAPPAAVTGLETLLPRIDKLRQHHVPREKGELLHEVAWRLGELEVFLECVQDLAETLEKIPVAGASEGILLAKDALLRLRNSEVTRHLIEAMPGLLKEIRGIRSVTVGVNIDKDLLPSAATLLSVNNHAFSDGGPGFLATLFGPGHRRAGGIAPLHRVPDEGANPMLHPLFRDLSEVLSRSLRPVAAALREFTGIRTQFLDRWGRELAFFLGAAKLVVRLRAVGLPLCRPRIGQGIDDGFRVNGLYNIVLALKLAEQGREAELSHLVVRNDLAFSAHEVTILTGPNQGGKTTSMRSIGLAHVLCQAGLYVPGSDASLGVVDAIHTHFPRGEHGGLDSGRFADEMRRLRDVFTHATPRSLILLNESLTATSARESLELAREVVSALQMLGARAVYTTHMFELAEEADAFNQRTAGAGRVTSLVARPGQSFRIERGPPSGSSEAREVASRFGISYAQLVSVLRQRGIVD
jgi:hypothetical protein